MEDKSKISAEDRDESDASAETDISGAADMGAHVRDERHLLALFIGPNSDSFLKIYDADNDTTKRFKWRGWAGINLVAGLIGLPWFLYRKLYIEGAALILIPIVLAFLLPDLMDKVQLSLSGVIAVLANQYYVHRSSKKVKAIESLDTPTEERDALLQSRGGVSIFGAIFGTIILCSIVGLIFYEATNSKTLPACDGKQTQALVKDLVIKTLAAKNVPTETLTLKEYQVEGEGSDTRRMCSVRLSDHLESRKLSFAVEWLDKTAGQFQVKFNPTN